VLKPYYMVFTESYPHSAARLRNYKEESAPFNNFLQGNKSKTGGLSIEDYLIQPVQRIPRYNLLLTDLLKYTPEDHVDYKPLQDALQVMLKIAKDINNSMKQGQNRHIILSIQESFVNLTKGFSFIAPHRLFINQGNVSKVCRKATKSRTLFLFNDILVVASTSLNSTNKYVLHHRYELSHLRIEDVPDSDIQKNAFTIVGQAKSFVVFDSTHQKKVDWMVNIVSATEEWKAKQKTFRIEESEDSEAPIWVPDSQANRCQCCQETFSFVKRKHHCRACGALICSTCSNQRLPLQHIGPKERVCKDCYLDLSLSEPVTE